MTWATPRAGCIFRCRASSSSWRRCTEISHYCPCMPADSGAESEERGTEVFTPGTGSDPSEPCHSARASTGGWSSGLLILAATCSPITGSSSRGSPVAIGWWKPFAELSSVGEAHLHDHYLHSVDLHWNSWSPVYPRILRQPRLQFKRA